VLRPLCFAKWDRPFYFPGQAMDVPKCKNLCPQRLNPGVSIHLSSFAMSSSLFRDASEGAEMRNHLVRKRPLGHAKITRFDFIMLAAVCGTALVTVLTRLA
jgi:hypothetical protein